MQDLLKNPTYQNKDGYNGLKMSNDFAFSSSVGHIIPFLWDFVQAGDKVSMSSYLRTRTQPLISAAMADIEENVRFFFVPLSQLYSPFKQLFVGVNDFDTDLFTTNIKEGVFPDYIPQIRLAHLAILLENYIVNDQPEKFTRVCRLCEAIGVPIYKMLEYWKYENRTHLQHSINLLPFLAYQKIWFDHFRDTDRIANDPSYYNFDKWFTDGDVRISSGEMVARLEKFVELRYCPVTKDAANCLHVSPLFGGADVNSLGNYVLQQVNQWLTSSSITETIDTSGGESAVNPTTTFAPGNGIRTINPANLRAAFATEKLLEIVRRSPKHFDAQMLAQMGVKIPKGLDGESVSFGHHHQPLLIGDVVSTSNTYNADNDSGAMLGEIGGKGYSADKSGNFEFTAPFHGVVMAVFYARPKYFYHPFGIDKKLAYTRVSDFPRLQYDDLGQQPEFVLNQNMQNSQDFNTQIQGWNWRYMETKSTKPRAFGALARSLRNWVVSRTGVYGADPTDYYVKDTDINQILEIPYNPSVIDHISASDDFSVINASLFDSDPLINQIALDYRKASKISTYGLPKLL